MKKEIQKHGGKRIGSGRKPTGNAPARPIRMHDDLVSRIEQWSRKQADRPKFAAAVKRLVEYALDHWKQR